jgi:hypothetical protein
MGDQPVSIARMAALNLVAWEVAFTANGANGGMVPAPEVRYTVSRLAMAAPHMARRLPRVRTMLPPDVLAIVLANSLPATPPAPGAPGAADSAMVVPAAAGPAAVGTAAAAALLSVTGQAVRRAAARGTLRGAKSKTTGAWQFSPAAVEEYRRARGRG